MNVLSLDLEMNQPSGSIIQVGYVIGNLQTSEIFTEKEFIIKIPEVINPRITTLTGITQAGVDQGVSLLEAYDHLVEDHHKYKCFMNPLVWGGGDHPVLIRQLKDKVPEIKNIFGRRWIDAKTVFISYRIANNLKIQSGLAKSLTKLGLFFEGKKHTAKDDAKNTFRIYIALLKKLKEEKQG